jgi:hypothetical protein
VVAIPVAAGARYAPCWVMRALLRTLLLAALLAAGWLLGSGISQADEDPGLPGGDLIHVVNIASSTDGSPQGSNGRTGAPPAAVGSPITRSAVTKALSAVSVPQLPVQPPVRTGQLRSIMNSAGLPKPLAKVLVPVSRPLSSTTPHGATSAPAPADSVTVPVRVSPATPASAGTLPRAVVRIAAATLAPAGRTAHVEPLRSPAHPAVAAVIVQPATGDSWPADPSPASPPGSSTSACLLDGATGGAGTKGGPDLAVPAGSAMTHLAQPAGLSTCDTSDLPRSHSAEPSASPD